jgi:hypothetical protein
MKHYLSFVILCLLSVLFSGCDKTPAGFPKVVPAALEVFNGSEPLANVQVSFTPSEPLPNTVIGGRTNTSGRAEIYTTCSSYRKSGVPPAEYSVTLREIIPLQHTKTPQEISALTFEQQKAYEEEIAKKAAAVPRKIPADLSIDSKTLLKWKPDLHGGTLRIDVAGKSTAP